MTQKILGALQREAGPDQVVSARLLPIAEGDAVPAPVEAAEPAAEPAKAAKEPEKVKEPA